MNKIVRSFQLSACLSRKMLLSSEIPQLNRLSLISSSKNYSTDKNELVTCDYSHDDKIALVSFNAPEKLNALSVDMGHAFKATINNLADKQDLRALILTGKGTFFFICNPLSYHHFKYPSSFFKYDQFPLIHNQFHDIVYEAIYFI